MEKKGGGFSAHAWEVHRQAKLTSVSLLLQTLWRQRRSFLAVSRAYCWHPVRVLLLHHNMAWAALDDSQREYSDSGLSIPTQVFLSPLLNLFTTSTYIYVYFHVWVWYACVSAHVHMAQYICGGCGTTHGSQVSLSTMWNQTRVISLCWSTLNHWTIFCALSS